MSSQSAVQILFKKNYLTAIQNAAKGENHTFRNFFITLNGEERDALANGALSCGTFLSSMLYLQNSTLDFLKKPKWISYVHANVPSVEEDMQNNGWHLIDEPREGSVLVWEERKGLSDGKMHLHIGFFLGNEEAVSNGSNSTLMPEKHHYTYNGARKIIRIWWHSDLEA